jgi:serine/threonine protein kinase
MAPEVYKKKDYRFTPDWWSLGIIIYQFMNKKNPFDTPKIENKNNLDSDAFDKECDRIFEERVCEMEWVWEPHTKIYSPKLKDLVVKLLDRDMTTRIGAKNGSEEILAHPVF